MGKAFGSSRPNTLGRIVLASLWKVKEQFTSTVNLWLDSLWGVRDLNTEMTSRQKILRVVVTQIHN